MKVLAAVAAAFLIAGCKTSQPIVEPTEVWEGHYYSKDAAQESAGKIELKEGQSVWILSNSTLKRLLTNFQGK